MIQSSRKVMTGFMKRKIKKQKRNRKKFIYSLAAASLLILSGGILLEELPFIKEEKMIQLLYDKIEQSLLSDEEKEALYDNLESLKKNKEIILRFEKALDSRIEYHELETSENEVDIKTESIDLEEQDVSFYEEIPVYDGKSFVVMNGNVPYFQEEDLTTDAFEKYSDLDDLGRAGVAFANIGIETMPTEKRGSIGMIQPSGWHTIRYDDLVQGKYLYHRTHLIGFQLAGENANEKNLITGTRYLNVEGMLPFENMIDDYVEETQNHVLYRVTPIYTEKNLVADGVLMEAMSVEDNGQGIEFNVFVYNVQPGILIDYATGNSRRADERVLSEKSPASSFNGKNAHA